MRVLWAGCVRVCEFRLLAEKLLTVYSQGLRESHRNFSRPLISGDPFIFKKIVVLAARSRADVTPAPTSAPSGASRASPGPGAAQRVRPRCSSPPLRAPRHCPCKVPALGRRPRRDVCLDVLACSQSWGRDRTGLGPAPTRGLWRREHGPRQHIPRAAGATREVRLLGWPCARLWPLGRSSWVGPRF